jgi:5-methylcytosine-specific restriction endonuclease McrA
MASWDDRATHRAMEAAEARPYPKDAQLARGARRYRRKVASPKQWAAILAAKGGPCRVCHGSRVYVEYHHLVSRQDGGGDEAANIVPLCRSCHAAITRRTHLTALLLFSTLTPEERRYMEAIGGDGYDVRAYGVAVPR